MEGSAEVVDVDRSNLHAVAVRASAGDREALDQLVKSLYDGGLARRSVTSVLIDRDAIEEAAQETVIAAARSITSFRGESSFETWLWTIGRRCASRVLRSQSRSASDEPLDESVESGEVARISSMIATRRSLEDVIAVLPEKYAATVYLRDVEGRTYQEIADALGLNLNTVRTRLARGRALAAARLDPTCDEP